MKQILKNIVKVLFFPLLVIRAAWKSKLTPPVLMCLFTALFGFWCGWTEGKLYVNFGALVFCINLFCGMLCVYILFRLAYNDMNEHEDDFDDFLEVNLYITTFWLWPIVVVF